jgi:predicted transcriptional regulator
LSPLRSDGQIRRFSRWLGRRLDHVNSGQRRSKGELENNSRKPSYLTKNWQSDSIKKGQLKLSRGKMKKEDDVADDDNDGAVRNSVSKDRVIANTVS